MKLPDRESLEAIAARAVVDSLPPSEKVGRVRGDSLATIEARLEYFKTLRVDKNDSVGALPPDAVVDLMVVAVLSVARLRPLEATANERFAELLVSDLAGRNGYELRIDGVSQMIPTMVSLSEHDPSDAAIDLIRAWIRGSLEVTPDLTSPRPLLPARLHTFLASPLSGVENERLADLERLAASLEEVLREHVGEEYLPLSLYEQDENFIDDDIYDDDLVVALISQPSAGVGVALSYAHRQRHYSVLPGADIRPLLTEFLLDAAPHASELESTGDDPSDSLRPNARAENRISRVARGVTRVMGVDPRLKVSHLTAPQTLINTYIRLISDGAPTKR